MMKNDIGNIVKNGLCIGCGLCESVNKGACKMHLNSAGFYQPQFVMSGNLDVNYDVRKFCPGVHICNTNRDVNNLLWGAVERVANAWAKDDFVRKSSSSGGVTSALAIYLLESHQVDAVLHVGVQDGTYLYNQLFVSTNREEVLSRNSSRYAPVAIFDNIIELLDENPVQTYVFIGKPCDIAALQNLVVMFPDYGKRIKYYLSIFCAGMPSYNATKRALDTFRKNEEPVSLRYRGDGWPGYFLANYADGMSYKMTYNESWGRILGRDLCFRCKICPDGIGLLADISSGDAWNTQNGYPDFTEDDGKNFCFVRTQRGLMLFEAAEKAGYIQTEALNIDSIKYMQRYQYERRHLVGWRIIAVQIFTLGCLNFRGIGFYRMALQNNLMKGLHEFVGTIKRCIEFVRRNG